VLRVKSRDEEGSGTGSAVRLVESKKERLRVLLASDMEFGP